MISRVWRNTNGFWRWFVAVGAVWVVTSFGSRLTAEQLFTEPVRIKSTGSPDIYFELYEEFDIGCGLPPIEHVLQYWDLRPGFNFAIADGSNNTIPFQIVSGAPSNSLFIGDNGRVGLGTDNPSQHLHVLTSDPTAGIRLESVNAGQEQTWDLTGDVGTFTIRDSKNGKQPFRIAGFGQVDDALFIQNNGRIGFGTADPEQDLHVRRANNSAVLRLEETNFGTTAGAWDISGSSLGFDVKDVVAATSPLSILPGAPSNSLFVAANGSVGMGTNVPNQLGSNNGTGRFFTIRASGNTAATGVANGAFQGQLGAQNHFVHLGAPANARIMRLQTSAGFTGFHALNDNLTSYAQKSILMMNMVNGNVGFKVDAPVHPIHMASGARCTSGGAWTNASSRELKQDIEPLSLAQARDTVRKLEPVSYRYKNETEETYIGFIAEDVPDLVATKDRKALAAMDITAVLAKVVQDQDRKLTDHEKQLERQLEEQRAINKALMERLAKLEQKLAE